MKQAGGAGEDYGRGVAVTSDGYAASGSFSGVGTSVFDAGVLDSLGGRDVHVAKFQNNDTTSWVQRLGGAGDDEGAEISSMADDGFVLCGSFAQQITFGAHSQVSGGARDIMLARLAANGSPLWLGGTMVGSGDDVGYACASDTSGNAYFAGSFSTIAPFGYDVAVSPTRQTDPNQEKIVYGKIEVLPAPAEPLLFVSRGDPATLRLSWPSVPGAASFDAFVGHIHFLRATGYDHVTSGPGLSFPDAREPSSGCDVAAGPAVTARWGDPGFDAYVLLAAVSPTRQRSSIGHDSLGRDLENPAVDPRAPLPSCP